MWVSWVCDMRVLFLGLLESCLNVTDALASLRVNENFRR